MRHCDTSRKVAGSIPDDSIVLGSTEPGIFLLGGGKDGKCAGLKTLNLHVPITLTPSGPVQACTGTALPLTLGLT